MTVGTYGIFDRETGECLYVGISSISVENRFKQHLKKLRNGTHPRKDFVEWFHIRGDSQDLLSFRILEECENNYQALNASEIRWFHELLPKYFGKQPSMKELWTHSEDSKRKVSKSLKKLYRNTYLDSQRNKITDFANDPSITKSGAAQFLGVTTGVLTRYMNNNEIEWKYDFDDNAEEELLIKWYLDEKLSTRKIAAKLNISQPSVVQKLSKLKDKDSRFSEIKERQNRVPIEMTEERSRRLSESLKTLEKILCQYCSERFSPMNIKRHETACENWTRCGCGKKLSKRTAQKCLECKRKSTA